MFGMVGIPMPIDVIAQQDVGAVFQAYIEVCNRALDRNKERFPYLQIWQAVEELIGDQRIVTRVEDHPDQPLFTISMKNNHLRLESYSGAVPSCVWNVKQTYLQDIIRRQPSVIDHPAMLDWSWLGGSYLIP